MALFASRVASAWAVVLPIPPSPAASLPSASRSPARWPPRRRRDRRRHRRRPGRPGLGAAIAVGVSALVGSRGPVIGMMLAFYLAVQNLLLAMGFLMACARSSPTAIGGSATSSRPRTCRSGWAPAVLVRSPGRPSHSGRRMAHQDPRDLVHAARGRGYADRVSSALRRWLGDPSPRMVDVAITVAVGVPVVGTTLASGIEQDRVLAGLAFGLAATLLLLVRRRWPFAVLAISLAARSPRRSTKPCSRSWWRCTRSASPARGGDARRRGNAAAAGLIDMLAGGTEFTYDDLTAVGLVRGQRRIGLFVRSRERVEVFRERAERLERERELLAQRAVAEERVRIAQEGCDVVTHSVSMIVVRAQGSLYTVLEERVTAATADIAKLGREARRRCRTLKLRAGEDQTAERAAAGWPTSATWTGPRAAGLRIELAVEGDPAAPQASTCRVPDPPGGADQRGQARRLRAHTTVLLGYRAHALELIVTDTGDGAAASSRQAATASSACASAPRCSAAASPPARAATTSRSAVLPYGEGRPRQGPLLQIADDQPMMRAGFKAVLEATGNIEVVAEAGNGEEAVAAATKHAPDVVLMDIPHAGDGRHRGHAGYPASAS